MSTQGETETHARDTHDATEIDAQELLPLLPEGTRIGRYELVRAIGRGAFADVYEGKHRDLKKPVALKILREEQALHPVARARFNREGVVAARLRHPNIVDVTDTGTFDGRPYLVMELLDGETLGARLEREGPLPLSLCLDLFLPVLSAVSAAHDLDLVHRDLKPDNIFLARSGPKDTVPKVLDFGVVKSNDRTLGHGAVTTVSGTLLGTPAYMSPEQALGIDKLDARSDVFSLGSVLYECLTGKRAFDGEALLPVLQRVCDATITPVSALRNELPAALDEVIAWALARDPELRCPSVNDLAHALLPYASPRAREEWNTPTATPPPLTLAPINPSISSPVLASDPRSLDPHIAALHRWPASAHRRFSVALFAVSVIASIGFAAWASRTPHHPSNTVFHDNDYSPAPTVTAQRTPPSAVVPVTTTTEPSAQRSPIRQRTIVPAPRPTPLRRATNRAPGRALPTPSHATVTVGANGAVIAD